MAPAARCLTAARICPRGVRVWILGGLLWLGGLWISAALAAAPPPLRLDPALPHTGLGGHLSFFKDASGDLRFDEIRAAQAAGRFELVQGDAVSAGYLAGKPLWIYFAVDHAAGDASTWWLFLVPELLDRITVYAEQPDGRFIRHEGGRSLPFEQREMPGIGHAFKLGQDPGGVRRYFVRTQFNPVIKVESSLWQEKPLYRLLLQANAVFGAYAGLVGMLILMALTRALIYRNRWDVAYLGYLIGFEMFHLTNAGPVQAWGLTDHVGLRQGLIQGGILMTSWSFVALTRYLIGWPAPRSPGFRLLLLGFTANLLLLALVGLTRPDAFGEINFDIGVSLIALSTIAGLRAAWKGYPNARALSLCFLPFVAWAVFVAVVRWTDAFGIDAWTRNRVLMLTSLLHLFWLWLLIFGREARLKAAKRALELRLFSLREEMANIGLFLDMLTHELNRPLQALAALTHPAPGGNPDDDVARLRQQLAAIRTEFTGIMEVCVGRIQQASISTLSPRDVDLRELIQRIAGHFQQSSRQHLISVELDALPTRFHCDPKLVGILLINLLENAARHAPEGGVIWVTGRRTADDAVEIAIMDEGPGIAATEQARIFERYTQGDAAATRKQGMGLGLFIVRRIAEMHGGMAVCESEPGEGSTFRVTLRRCSADDPPP